MSGFTDSTFRAMLEALGKKPGNASTGYDSNLYGQQSITAGSTTYELIPPHQWDTTAPMNGWQFVQGTNSPPPYVSPYGGLNPYPIPYPKPLPTPQELAMKKFTEKELADGQYAELEKIQTPKPGTSFDTNQLTVASVLTLNKMVEVIEELRSEIVKLKALQAMPAKEEPEFKLPSLVDGYKDVAA